LKKNLYILFFCVVSFAGAQNIVDDTSKLVYSAKTTEIFYEFDVKNNFPKERHPDTTLYNFESFTYLDKAEHYYQDLGNNGTAMQHLFYPLATQIGKTSGYSIYNTYMKMPDQLKYYDTKSPYMDVKVVFGGNFRSTVDYSYARSVNERWTMGFDIHKITSGKQLNFTRIDDRNVQGSVFDVYTSYQHETIPYRIMFNVVSMNHNVSESGGIALSANPSRADYFLYKDANVNLTDARAKDGRTNWHIYHEYAWQKQLQFYHQIDLRKQENTFSDAIGTAELKYYGPALIDNAATNQKSLFKELINEVGVKSELANLFFRGYLKHREYDFSYLYLDPIGKQVENYLGGYSRFTWKDKFNIEAEAEYLQTGEYKLIGRLNSDFLFGSYSSVRAKAPIFYEQYLGNHQEWNNNFSPTFTNEIKGGIRFKTNNFMLRPTARILSMSNYLYLDENLNPNQSAALGVLTAIGGDFHLNIKTNKQYSESFHFENEIYVTKVSGGASANMPVPPVFYNGRLFWRGSWFKKTMPVEVGLDLHAKTSYYAFDYSPNLQQFYVQNSFKIDAFYTADLFLNMKVDNVKVFVKMTHVNQQNNDGYFITPYYPGVARVFDLGVNWLFFD
jgi:hypothetical protein